MNIKKNMYFPPQVKSIELGLQQHICGGSSDEDKYEFFDNPIIPIGDGGVEQMF